ncbi:hypothetical protein [Candidatus Pantoea soli]|uniref:hypothetical protein n=1 Tax=Candidatus Pantoea soli TaxID=3098669 RepID=UPI0011A27563|nr:hypothetical protein [Pantoea soli]
MAMHMPYGSKGGGSVIRRRGLMTFFRGVFLCGHAGNINQFTTEIKIIFTAPLFTLPGDGRPYNSRNFRQENSVGQSPLSMALHGKLTREFFCCCLPTRRAAILTLL